MAGPHPAVAAVRSAVRRTLSPLDPGSTVVVACSGGADSLALAAAAVFEGRKLGLRLLGVTVDHQLQPGSSDQAQRVLVQLRGLGVDETLLATVTVNDAGGLGPEAAAREARYDVLRQVADRGGASLVLLGHTLDDQAETVLMGLTRGSGVRSLAGMRRSFEVFVRPLLELTRTDTETACTVEGLEWWEDPHNTDRRYTRVRLRHTVLPLLERELGPGVARTLARTADQARLDVQALDALAGAAYEELRTPAGLPLRPLAEQYEAISSRVLRLAALDAGATDAELFHVHVGALVGLAAGTIRGEVQLPGHVTAYREHGHLRFRPTAVQS